MYAKGDLAAAESLYREALEVQRETLGDRHPDTLISMDNLGVLLQDTGDLAAADLLFREAEAAGGDAYKEKLAAINKLGVLGGNPKPEGGLAAADPC